MTKTKQEREVQKQLKSEYRDRFPEKERGIFHYARWLEKKYAAACALPPVVGNEAERNGVASKWKQLNDVRELKQGDIVRGKLSKQPFQIVANYGNRATGVNNCDVTNPSEWEILRQ